MAYFEDLTPYIYGGAEESNSILNIGWLSDKFDFPTGKLSRGIFSKIDTLIKEPTNLYRGSHHCEFCPQPIHEKVEGQFLSKIVRDCHSGNGEIRVQGDNGITYVAPTLIAHYIEAHQYLPPREFINAISLAIKA